MKSKKAIVKAQVELNSIAAQAKALIAKHGFTVIGREASATFPKNSHTLGLAAQGLPELILVGLDEMTSRIALNTLAKRMLAGESIATGVRITEILSTYSVLLQEVDAAAAAQYLKFAQPFANGKPLKAYQVIWPDPAGRFPGEPDYDTSWLEIQPLLYSASGNTLH